jgi:hypothetical protein
MSNISKHVYIPSFISGDVQEVSFGGFLCDKYINSQLNSSQNNRFSDVAPNAAPSANPSISRMGVPIWDKITIANAMIACANRGTNWHLMTPFEWASLVMLSYKYRIQPHGADNLTDANSADDLSEIGALDLDANRELPPITRALPGSGPVSWAHNKQGTGVYDLFGIADQYIMAFMNTAGKLLVPATDGMSNVSSFGRGMLSGNTIICNGTGTYSNKNWTGNQYVGNIVFIAETNSFYSVTSNTANTVTLGSSAVGSMATFCIFQVSTVDITGGWLASLPSGQSATHVATNINITDSLLKKYAIPTISGVLNPYFNKNNFQFTNTGTYQSISRGGRVNRQFSMKTNPLNYFSSETSFRACKTL